MKEFSKGTPVSEEMNAVLNRIAGNMPKEIEVIEVMRSYLTDRQRGLGYARCTWWDGCLYCQNDKGEWEQISCAA